MINWLKNKIKRMGQIIINGETYVGTSINIRNSKVIINGKNVIDMKDLPKVEIKISGTVNDINVDYCDHIDVDGNIGTLVSTSGDVSVNGDVTSLKTTSGDVQCDDVKGDVTSVSGDIVALNITGSVKTVSGDITQK